MGYSLYLTGLVCIGGIASIVIGVAIYLVGNKFRLVKAILAATGVFFLIAVGFPWLMATLNDVRRGAWVTFEAAELVGTWEATYKDVGPNQASGLEILTLRADSTYQQIYKDGKGYVYTSPWYKWWLEDGRIIHLEHGRFYPYGISMAEALGKGDTIR
jgi:hypothetical protein